MLQTLSLKKKSIIPLLYRRRLLTAMKNNEKQKENRIALSIGLTSDIVWRLMEWHCLMQAARSLTIGLQKVWNVNDGTPHMLQLRSWVNFGRYLHSQSSASGEQKRQFGLKLSDEKYGVNMSCITHYLLKLTCMKVHLYFAIIKSYLLGASNFSKVT